MERPTYEEWNKVQRKKIYQTVTDHLRDYLLLSLGVLPDWYERVVNYVNRYERARQIDR